MHLFRLHRAQRRAADYGGSLLYANRWNQAGTPMLYASSSLALACLEVLVHLTPSQIPSDYVYSVATLDEPPEVADFRGDPADELATRRFGQWWANERQELAIQVPSVIVPVEFNVLLSPTHSDFTRIRWYSEGRFSFDPRLLRVAE